MGCNLPGFSVDGIIQTRILEMGCHFLLQGIFLTHLSCVSIVEAMDDGEKMLNEHLDQSKKERDFFLNHISESRCSKAVSFAL